MKSYREHVKLSEISQPEEKKYRMIHFYVESKEQSKPTSQMEADADTESGLVVARGQRVWGPG